MFSEKRERIEFAATVNKYDRRFKVCTSCCYKGSCETRSGINYVFQLSYHMHNLLQVKWKFEGVYTVVAVQDVGPLIMTSFAEKHCGSSLTS